VPVAASGGYRSGAGGFLQPMQKIGRPPSVRSGGEDCPLVILQNLD